MDLNKEIKLSDLFRRKAKTPGEDGAAAPEEEKPKKERRALFSRAPREKAEKAPKPPKQPKEPRRSRREKAKGPAVEERPAVEIPQIPLMRAFNLLPKEGMGEQKTMSAGFARVALALLALLVVAALGAGYMLMSSRAKEKQGQVDDLRAQLAEVTAAVPEQLAEGAGTAVLAGESQARAAALGDALASRVAWDRTLREFALVVPDDVWLATLTTSTGVGEDGSPTGQASFTITGFAESHASVALLLSRLSVLPEFASVQLQSSARGQSTTGEGSEEAPAQQGPASYSFTIVATLVPGGVTSS